MKRESKAKRKREENETFHAEYVRDGCMRSVVPYVHNFSTFAKGRWLGREVYEVLTREFGGHSAEYWSNAIRCGHVLVNGHCVDPSYKFRNSDALIHRTHRHEPPTFGEIVLVGETEDVVAVDKPPSLPMHPCGAYRFNSLVMVLAKEPLSPTQPAQLRMVHRLDRVTGGLVILAKTADAARRLAREIRDKQTKKTYLALVRGKFPADTNHLSNLLSEADAVEALQRNNNEMGQELNEEVKRKWNNLVTTVGELLNVSDGDEDEPENGERPEEGDNNKCEDKPLVGGDSDISSKKARLAAEKKDEDSLQRKVCGNEMRNHLANVEASKEEIGMAPGVGFACLSKEVYWRALLRLRSPTADAISDQFDVCSSSTTGISTSTYLKRTAGIQNPYVLVRCPLGVINHREGVHGYCTTGKSCVSLFRLIGYDTENDTSLVECIPHTGRTHQLRLHLRLLSNPIANDPCYGGELFFGQPQRYQEALSYLQELHRFGVTPLSKIPHLLQSVCRNLADSTSCTPVIPSEECLHAESKKQDESEEQFLQRTCRYCKAGPTASALESCLHCDGIFLHALRYEKIGSSSKSGEDDRLWSFETPIPSWAKKLLEQN